VVGSRGDDSDLDPVLGVPSGEPVKDVDVVSGVQVVDSSFTVDLEGVFADRYIKRREHLPANSEIANLVASHLLDRNVDATPPNVILATILVDDTLVLGAPSRLLSRKVDQGTGGREDGAFVHDGILVQGGDGSVTLDVDLVHVETGLGEVLDVLAEDYE
jgi:hypothetical protein